MDGNLNNPQFNTDDNNVGLTTGRQVSEREEKLWFVMRDLKRPNAKLPAYKELAAQDVIVYTPLQTVLEKDRTGAKAVRRNVPYIRDLLFVYETRERMDKIVERIDTLQYRFLRGAYRSPMTVGVPEMARFISCSKDAKIVKYYSDDELTPDMLQRKVRIVGGPMDQFEGYLQTVRGSKFKRLLVGIPNVVYKSVLISTYDYIEPLE